MPGFLPPSLLVLFEPRDPLRYLPPPDQLPYEKENSGYSGIACFVKEFEVECEKIMIGVSRLRQSSMGLPSSLHKLFREIVCNGHPVYVINRNAVNSHHSLHIMKDPKDTPPPSKIETREEIKERKAREKAEQAAYKLEQDIALWTPKDNPNATTDPYKTLFVGRLNYDTSKSKLRREFEQYGPISKIIMVQDKNTGRPRGYAFIEYEREKDMRSAYKHADGKKIDGRRVVVDIERGRTIQGWLPRRLGGGLGGRRNRDADAETSGIGETPHEDRYRSRDRHRERHKRDRSRDRGRGRDREAVVGGDKGGMLPDMMNDMGPDMERKERRRSRSRDRERKRRRSRSRDRNKRRDYDRGERDSGRRERGDRDERIRDEGMMIDVNNQDDFNNNMNYEGDFNNYGGPEGGYNAY